LLRPALAVIAAAVWISPAAAAERPNFGPPAAWIAVADIPEAPPEDGAAAAQVVLDDNQTRFSPEGDSYYNRRVYRIARAEGLTGFQSRQVTWDPAIEQVAWHTLRIIRGGKTIDLLKGGKDMLVLRRETNLERAMLDGRLTASRQIEGLQVGDLIDMAWTVTRRDPIVEGHSYDYERMQFPGAAGRYRVRVSWPQAQSVRWKASEGYGEPAVTSKAGWSVLERDQALAVAPKPPLGAPQRFQRLGDLEVSSYGAWADVSRVMSPHFAKAAALKPDSDVRAQAAAIAAEHKDSKARAFAALKLVEDQTRYLFLGMGEGGYIPAAADETWDRRFGDCKGKTVLLLALLKELGIEAEPALVSLGGGDGMDERLPSLSAFNHVLVRASIEGRTYWLDGTRSGDRGGLDALPAPGWRWALPLRTDGAELERVVEPPLGQPQVVASIHLDASKGLAEAAPARVEMRMQGDAAAGFQLMAARAPKADLERTFRQAFSASYSWIELDAVTWDSQPSSFSLVMTGKADVDWRENPDLGVREFRLPGSGGGVAAFPKREPGPNRDAPYALAYPMFRQSVTEVVLPNGGRGFTIRGPNGDQTVGGYEVKQSSAIKGDVARFTTEVRAVTPEIPASEIEGANRALRSLAAQEYFVRAPK
jgi:transglutaminase-like putative cysteine protease